MDARPGRSLLATLCISCLLAAGVISIAGCGGGSSEATASEANAVVQRSECDVGQIEGALLGVESGIESTRRRLLAALKGKKFLPSPEPGAKKQSIRVSGLLALKTMEENAATIRGALKSC
jgi:hypothetical protein